MYATMKKKRNPFDPIVATKGSNFERVSFLT